MTVPSNPSLTQVYAEFGAPLGTPLSAFLRGGSWVPNTAANINVPTSLPISLSQLAGATRYTPMSASANNVSDTVDATITGYSFGPSVCSVTGGNPSKTYAWSHISGTNFTIASPTSASTNFVHGGHPPVGTYSGTYKCTVSDGTSSVDSNTITVTLTRT